MPQRFTAIGTMFCRLQTADSPGLTPPRFEYDLVGDGDRRAFLPREDRDLLRAYYATDSKPGDRAAGVLLAEIERRGLET